MTFDFTSIGEAALSSSALGKKILEFFMAVEAGKIKTFFSVSKSKKAN
jgi:hypothetical protein